MEKQEIIIEAKKVGLEISGQSLNLLSRMNVDKDYLSKFFVWWKEKNLVIGGAHVLRYLEENNG